MSKNLSLEPFAYCTFPEFEKHVADALKGLDPGGVRRDRDDRNILTWVTDLIDKMGLTQDVYEHLRDREGART